LQCVNEEFIAKRFTLAVHFDIIPKHIIVLLVEVDWTTLQKKSWVNLSNCCWKHKDSRY